ncbi:MAG: hypothetical protein KDD44_09315, partial [Bdellovibrionales bacterium]|nr:hypothetical protein [Bdellovibrionales bacterium]
EVSVGPYKILVNDTRTQHEPAAVAPRVSALESGYHTPQASASDSFDDWQDEHDLRIAGRKFVFGSPPEEEEPGEGTLSVGRAEFASQIGLGLSPSQRFQSGLHQPLEAGAESAMSERMMLILGMIVFAGIVVIVLLAFLR